MFKLGLARRLLRGGAWMLLNKVINAVGVLLSTAFVTRLLTPEQVGGFFMAYAAVQLLAHPCSVGLATASTRLVAEAIARRDAAAVYTGLIRAVMWTAAVAAVIGASVIGVCLDPLAALLGPENGGLSGVGTLLAIWTGTQAIRLVVAGLFRGRDRMGAAALFDGVLSNVLTAAVLGTTLALGATVSLHDVLSLVIAANVVSTAFAVITLYRTTLRGRVKSLPYPLRRLLGVALPMMGTMLLPLAGSNGTLWIVGVLGGPGEAALYGAAMRLFQSLGILFAVSHLAGGPLVAELHVHGDRIRMQHMARAIAAVTALPALGAVLLLLFFGREFIEIIFGGGFYAGAISVVLILSVGLTLQIALGPNVMLLMMTGHERALVLVQSAGASALLALAALGYRISGLEGLAAGVASAFVLEALSLAMLVHRRLGFWPVAIPDVRLLVTFVRRRLAYNPGIGTS